MFILIINPLFNFIFKMGDDLVFALEARGYKTNSKWTHYQKLEYSKLDIFAIFFMIVFTFFFVIMKTLDYLYSF